jgi:hypothetical protein
MIVAKTLDDQIDREATQSAWNVIQRITRTYDYTLGFQLKSSFEILCEQLRYLALMRGAAVGELVLDKTLAPDTLRILDPISIRWYEKKPNEYKPVQVQSGSSDEIDLDTPDVLHLLLSSRPDDDLFVQPLRRRHQHHRRASAGHQRPLPHHEDHRLPKGRRHDPGRGGDQSRAQRREGRQDQLRLWLNDRMNEVVTPSPTCAPTRHWSTSIPSSPRS